MRDANNSTYPTNVEAFFHSYQQRTDTYEGLGVKYVSVGSSRPTLKNLDLKLPSQTAARKAKEADNKRAEDIKGHIREIDLEATSHTKSHKEKIAEHAKRHYMELGKLKKLQAMAIVALSNKCNKDCADLNIHFAERSDACAAEREKLKEELLELLNKKQVSSLSMNCFIAAQHIILLPAFFKHTT